MKKKHPLVKSISQEFEITDQEAHNYIARFFTCFVNTLETKTTVSIPNFGKFYFKEREAKFQRDPRDRANKLLILPKTNIIFRPSVNLKKKLNKKDTK